MNCFTHFHYHLLKIAYHLTVYCSPSIQMLLLDPVVLFLDEPTSGLDAFQSQVGF